MKNLLLLFLFVVSPSLFAFDGDWDVTVEAGPVWFSRNDVAVPGDEGTKFNLLGLTGDGPELAARFILQTRINDKHQIRLTLAPIATEGSSTLDENVQFKSTEFTTDSSTKAVYEFNTYRLGYSYVWRDDATWTLSAGASLLVRDAKIELSQNGITETEEDLGVAPLV